MMILVVLRGRERGSRVDGRATISFFAILEEEEEEEEEEVGSLTETRSTEGRRVGGLRYIRGAQFKPT